MLTECKARADIPNPEVNSLLMNLIHWIFHLVILHMISQCNVYLVYMFRNFLLGWWCSCMILLIGSSCALRFWLWVSYRWERRLILDHIDRSKHIWISLAFRTKILQVLLTCFQKMMFHIDLLSILITFVWYSDERFIHYAKSYNVQRA